MIEISSLRQPLLTSLSANLATRWYQWEVRAEETNLTNPFVFNVVNAQGTDEELTSQGFRSTSWFLKRDGSSSESASVSSSVTSSTVTQSSTTSASRTASSESPLSTTRDTEAEVTATANQASETDDSGIGNGAIIGLTVGLVVAGAIIIVGVLYYLRKRQRRNEDLSAALPAPSYYDNKAHGQTQPAYQHVSEAFTQPPELDALSPVHELPGSSRPVDR